MTSKIEIEEQYLLKIDRILTLLEAQKLEPPLVQEWLTGHQACQVLGVCKRTLQKYRDELKIEFSQFGRKILYPKHSVIRFLKTHSNPEFSFQNNTSFKSKGGII